MSRFRPPALGERAKLTAVYASLIIAVCTVFVVVVYIALQQSLPATIGSAIRRSSVTSSAPPSATPGPVVAAPSPSSPGTGTPGPYALTRIVPILASHAALDRYLTTAIIALVALAAISVWIAWWLAGRVLRPVAVMAQAARTMSVTDLSRRIDLNAPPGELKQLADTFDQLLARIDTLVASQQRFVANAAHELRTQLAVQRSAAEVGLVDPTPERVERIRSKLLEAAVENEHLLEGLLLLATTDQGLQHSAPVAVDQLAESVTQEFTAIAAEKRVDISTDLASLTVVGDGVLLKHLIRNLVANALAYNDPVRGTISVTTEGHELVVTNTGAPIDPNQVDGLFEPFRRLNSRQHRPGEGAGLGLAIVVSIARAHSATVTAEANTGGGLTVRIHF